MALGCAGCSSQIAYLGTASLQTSGASTTQFASHRVSLTDCGPESDGDKKANPFEGGGGVDGTTSPGFSVLSVGDRCIIRGAGAGDGFRADSGATCTLVFAEGPRTLRVTDLSVRYGVTGSGPFLKTRSDPSYLQVTLGGDDTTSGVHAVYRFSGTSVGSDDPSAFCDAERPAGDPRSAVTNAPRTEAEANQQ